MMQISSVSDLFSQHPYWATAITTFVGSSTAQFLFSAAVSSMEAPTKDSSSKYKFWFKFLNKVAANLARAKDTSIENSPNWKDAVDKATNGKAPNGN